MNRLEQYAEEFRRRMAHTEDFRLLCRELHGAARMAQALGSKEGEALADQLHQEASRAWFDAQAGKEGR